MVPRTISEFARIGEKAADTFERLERETRKSLDEAVRVLPKTKMARAFRRTNRNAVFPAELRC